ncbi:PqqD family peptide modification chaperone [Streptomyces sp. NPDC092307]
MLLAGQTCHDAGTSLAATYRIGRRRAQDDVTAFVAHLRSTGLTSL